MKNKYFFRSMMVAIATLLMITSCSKDEKEPELTPQQKAEAIVQKLKGANSEVVTKQITTYYAQGANGADVVNDNDVKVSYSVETTTENGSPLVTLYVGYSFANNKSVNQQQTFLKFVPEITPVDTDRVKVSNKEIKEVAFLFENNAIFGEAAKGNTLVTEDGSKTTYENVTFEYNAKTKTINNLAITSVLKAGSITVRQKGEYKNLALDASQKVVPFGESQYKSGNESARSRSLTARIGRYSTLSGVKSIHIKMSPKSPMANMAYNNFQPHGNHYAKFTPLADGSIQMELCDANGVTNGGDPKVDNKTGFATPTMPMRLYFLNVKLYNNDGVITDAQNGHNYIKAMKRDDYTGGGFLAWMFGLINPNGQESQNAEVLTTTLGQNEDYDITVKTNLPLPFTAEIKIN